MGGGRVGRGDTSNPGLGNRFPTTPQLGGGGGRGEGGGGRGRGEGEGGGGRGRGRGEGGGGRGEQTSPLPTHLLRSRAPYLPTSPPPNLLARFPPP